MNINLSQVVTSLPSLLRGFRVISQAFKLRVVGVVVALLCISGGGWWGGGAWAYTGPELLVTPFAEERQTEGVLRGQSFSTDVRGEDERVRVQSIHGRARVRWDAQADHSPAFGTDVYYMNLSGADGLLPKRLFDGSVAAGLPLTRFAGLEWGVTAGGGFAGDLPFTDSRAWYGKASLIAIQRFDENRMLILGVDYHGNRTVFPDLPLPGALWVHNVSERFQYAVGVPFTNVTWRATEELTLRANYGIPTTFGAAVTYDLTPAWQLYTELDSHTRAFHLNNDDRHRRLFFRQRRLEAGVRYEATQTGTFTLGGGYAFGQRFDRGFDLRNTERVQRLSDEPYVRFAVEFSF